MFEEEFRNLVKRNKESISRETTDLDFIDYYKDYLDWNILIKRKDLVENPEFLERFKKIINWVNIKITDWETLWKYKNYWLYNKIKVEDGILIKDYACVLSKVIPRLKNKEEKYNILDKVIQERSNYVDKEEPGRLLNTDITEFIGLPEDVEFIRKYIDCERVTINWYLVDVKIDKDSIPVLREFKDKINWKKLLEDHLYWILNKEIFIWIIENVSDKTDWSNILINFHDHLPIKTLKLISSKIKEERWKYLINNYNDLGLLTIKLLSIGIKEPYEKNKENVLYILYTTFVKRNFTIDYTSFVSDYQNYIPWEDLIAFSSQYDKSNEDKNFIVKKMMSKETRKRLGYHVWFGKVLKY